MVLVREIVKILSGRAREGVECTYANLGEVYKGPDVEVGEDLKFIPRHLEAEKIKLAADVRGVRFLKEGREVPWRPENEDFLIGVGCFVDSAEFAGFGHVLGNRADKAECLEVTKRIISDLLDGIYDYGWLRDLLYDDIHEQYDYDDFRCFEKKLANQCYYCEGGVWHVKHPKDKRSDFVGPSVCAIGLLAGLEAPAARRCLFVKFPIADYDAVSAVIEQGGGEEAVKAFIRLTGAKKKRTQAYLFLNPETVEKVVAMIGESDHADKDRAERLIEKRFNDEYSKRQRAIDREAKEADLRNLMDFELGLGKYWKR